MVHRNTNRAWVSGVAAGLADHYDLPIWYMRLLFVLLFLCLGLGLFVYLHLWNKGKIIDYQLDLNLK